MDSIAAGGRPQALPVARAQRFFVRSSSPDWPRRVHDPPGADERPHPGARCARRAGRLGILGFVLAGVVAWWRRPESRFGILMVLAGTAWFLSTLASANLAMPYTIGIAFDLLPAALFLHVFLAFPTGRLERPFDRALVASAYVTAFGLQLARHDARRLRPGQPARDHARRQRGHGW